MITSVITGKEKSNHVRVLMQQPHISTLPKENEPEPEKQEPEQYQQEPEPEILPKGFPHDLYHPDGTPDYGKASSYLILNL